MIPARGKSKRLPRKNIADFFGQPIVAYTIKAAQRAGVFDRVLVSTEDDEIAEAAARFKAEVDRRPSALVADAVGVVEVCLELLDRLEQAGQRFDTLTVLYATAPLRTAEDIRATLALIAPGRCDFAMAVTEYVQPVHQALRLAEHGLAVPVFPDLVTRRSDSVDKFVAGNGSTYCVSIEAFRRERKFYGQSLRVHLMPRARAVDIDTAEDLALARFYYQRGDEAGDGHA